MGIIDQSTFTLNCQCGVSESVTIQQHGSAYGGYWLAGKTMGHFSVSWDSSNELRGPHITTARCKSCGSNPGIVVP